MSNINITSIAEQYLQQLSGKYCWETNKHEAYLAWQQKGFPPVKTEDYKYTPITTWLEPSFASLGPSLEVGTEAELLYENMQPFLQPSVDHYPILLVNGNLYQRPECPLNLQVQTFTEAYPEYQKRFETHFSRQETDKKDRFAALNTLLFGTGIWIHISADTQLAKPIWIYSFTDNRTQSSAHYPRVLIHMDENSQAHIIHSAHHLGAYPSFNNTVVEASVAAKAQLSYYNLQTQVGQAYQVHNSHVYQAEHSTVSTYAFSWDGLLNRNNVLHFLDGTNAHTNMYGLSNPQLNQHIDHHTTVVHAQPNTTSNELYKGIGTTKSTSVFNGKIFVYPEAQKTNAFQQNHHILLHDEAQIYTKPQLEIWADDVKCSHGATVGQIDPTALFYLQSRGIAPTLAKKMLVHAFMQEVLEKIQCPDVRRAIEKTLPTV